MAIEGTKTARVTMPTKEFEDAVNRLLKGELKLRNVASELGIKEKLAAQIRRKYLNRKYGIDLRALDKLDNAKFMDFDEAARKHTSQIVGTTGSLPISF
ncbi:MAG: hypothetical protein KGH69_05345, partial [Candidatus Micrarchaeota archaeon]|nr:hypothetical protein [Candidatus Micrarchaeota archaeon]